MVVLRLNDELNFSSLLDDTVFESTKAVLSARSGSYILKRPSDPYYPLVKEFKMWYAIIHRLSDFPIGAYVMKLTWFQEPNTALHGSGLCQRNNVTSLTSFSVPITRLEWYMRVILFISHRDFVSKSLMVSGVLCMLIISLMRQLY